MTLDLQAAIDKRADYVQMYPLGVCEDCPRPATIECFDGHPRCKNCAVSLAHGILIEKAAARHCTTAAQKKARVKRRKARKAARRGR